MTKKGPVEALFDELYSGHSPKHVDAEIERAIPQVDFIEEALELKPGQRVLDLGCGNGRHAISLARRGIDVTGLDISQVALDLAQQKADKEGIDLSLVKGDMRNLPLREDSFDAVYSYASSFGYSTFLDDLKITYDIARVLKPGGLFLIDYVNSGMVRKNFLEQVWDEGQTRYILKDRTLDEEAKRINVEWIFIYKGPQAESRHQITLEAYTPENLKAAIGSAGLEPRAVYGDIHQESYHDTFSERIIVVAQKPLE
ncbi:MAG: methyltransferase domain-containing protein [Candidatus Woesearchaeota archaeon]|jgi:D-alanine-D-alanine ligase|nr:methyltransferase domain-containing protein [Candidatus Woesearchaeota archaeon]